MIERATLVEQENGDAILFWLTDGGELRWLSGATETLRYAVEECDLPNFEHFRISDGMVHATPSTPKYHASIMDIFAYRRDKGAA